MERVAKLILWLTGQNRSSNKISSCFPSLSQMVFPQPNVLINMIYVLCDDINKKGDIIVWLLQGYYIVCTYM